MALLNIGLKNIYKGRYIPEIERLYCTIKERVHYNYNGINCHLNKTEGVLIIEMVYVVVFCISSLPSTDSISDTISPHATLKGMIASLAIPPFNLESTSPFMNMGTIQWSHASFRTYPYELMGILKADNTS